MKVFILASSFSGLCQRVLRELLLDGHKIDQHYGMDVPLLEKQLRSFEPDLVVCPFLTHRIPSHIWQDYRCLIVHPGIQGDRGPSSLDWAIQERADYWGVTLLQAAEEMDAGDIWGSLEFPMRLAGKTSLYKREVSSAAIKLIKHAVKKAQDEQFSPRPLDYSDPLIKGQCRPLMRQDSRKIDWQNETTSTILDKLNAADTSPGIVDNIFNHEVRLFGAIEEPELSGQAGDFLAIKYGAVCRATADGAVWIRQMKCANHPYLPPIKLPSETIFEVLSDAYSKHLLKEFGQNSETPNDIRVDYQGKIAYVFFDFYNGACNTEQCKQLTTTLKKVKQKPVKAIALMGGQDFFSNGIHLNCIEAAPSPAEESWNNINAIDDLILEIINTPNQVTISALRNNAGAGGAILALACDKVAARSGVVLNPHYKNMGLFGSEYWTYLLPKRVGLEKALEITQACQPMLAKEALEIGFADAVFDEDWRTYHKQLANYVVKAAYDVSVNEKLEDKRKSRKADELKKPLHEYRQAELKEMHASFYGQHTQYHKERRKFVYKGKVPEHLDIARSA